MTRVVEADGGESSRSCPDDAPAVSVVIPTYNRRARLEQVLDALSDQDFDEPYELIVISDGSTDGTNEYLAGRPARVPTRVTVQTNQGAAAARNRGVQLARGVLVVFVDDDVIADRKLLREHYEAHRSDPVLVTIGPMCTPPGFRMSAWIAWEQKMLARQYVAIDHGEWSTTARQFYTGNAALRREHLLAVDGFDTSFRRAEDVELAYRLAGRGLRFRFCPEAVGYHYAERSYASWLHAAYAYGRNDVVFAAERGQTWLYREVRDKLLSYPRPVAWGVRTAAVHPRLGRALARVGGWFARAAHRLGMERVSQTFLSGVYASEYYRGVADEFGSRDTFFEFARVPSA